MSGSMPDRERLVLGLDVGGTWTRALLATTDGRRVGVGRSAGANPAAHGVAVAAERIASAVSGALSTCDPSTVDACVVGLAGASQYAADPDTVRAFEEIWKAAGLTCSVQVTSDVSVAFAAGTPEPAGSILLAGTGAVAAEIRDRTPVTIHGGYGWLLGDDGSGFWIGRQAVRATLVALDDRAPMSPLPTLVLDWYSETMDADSERNRDGGRFERRGAAATLIREVNRRAPTSLAGLAPLVMQAHDAGDAAAEQIVRDAAQLLVANLEQIDLAHSMPVVLAGGLLSSANPVRESVVSTILHRLPAVELRTARDGAAAAAWLAALPLVSGQDAAGALHARLMPPTDHLSHRR